jgi:hypothetical protein
MSVGASLRARLDRIQIQALAVGVACLAAWVVAAFAAPAAAFPAYLVGFLYWVGIGVGCIAFTMLHHLVGGSWGLAIRKPLEAGAWTILPMAVLFLPVALGLKWIYPWASYDPAHSTRELAEAMHNKADFLSPRWFWVRSAGYFAFWAILAYLLNRGSAQQDETEDPTPTRRLQRISGPGLGLCFLTGTFAAIDWGMSLEPKWYSTIYGVMLIVGWGLLTFAAMIIVSALLVREEPLAHLVGPSQFQDLGNLMLAFVMLWAYMSFSQFLIIWAGNLTEEIPWYLKRTRGGWEFIALLLVMFHFFAPLLCLFSRDAKRSSRALMYVAAIIMVMHVIDLSWLVLPASTDERHPGITWGGLFLAPLAVVGLGGIWIADFLRHLKNHPLIPLHDPEINPAVEHEPGG